MNFFFVNLAISEIMWKNILQPYRPQKTVLYGRMSLASWITIFTDTHSEYAILIACLQLQ